MLDAILEHYSQYLYLSAEVNKTNGQHVNVSELFTVKFTLLNTAPTIRSTRQAKIVFLNPYLQVIKTDYAAPWGPDNEAWDSMGLNFRRDLNPGESANLEVEFVALRSMDRRRLIVEEPYTSVSVKAPLDVNELFFAHQQFEFSHDIRLRSPTDRE
ncbi:hypothetical protein [Agarivorans aestuarii]|uniref:hypothetical protein n=1 Tax=Agarivorans aestuarii TaxID=1563703 RepID=UPI001C80BA06|nr:hypothetical protein [Agarivorans aestuarii]